MPHKAKRQHFRCLKYVVTAAEAARMYEVNIRTVMYAIHANNLAAHKLGSVWLVSVPSLIAYWGDPAP